MLLAQVTKTVSRNAFRLSRLFLIVASLHYFAVSAKAEFLRTGIGVYQSTGGRGKVIVTTESPGILFLYGPKINLQTFNLKTMEDKGVLHAFLQYDPQLGKYTSLLVRDREYRVQGNFTMSLGKMRITVDNTNPYCSIVIKEHSEGGSSESPPEILGLLGTSVIINDKGEQAVAMLEANQFNEYRNVISPYTLQEEGLLVENAQVESPTIGIILDPKNECLKSDAAVVPRDLVASLTGEQESPGSASKAVLKKLLESLERARRNSPLKGKLKLRTTQDSIIVFDPITSRTSVVRRVQLASLRKLIPQSVRVVCGIEEVSTSH